MKKLIIHVVKNKDNSFTVTTEEINGITINASHPTHVSLALTQLRLNVSRRFIRDGNKLNKQWHDLVRDWEKIQYDLKYADPSHAPRVVANVKNTYY